MPPAVFLVAAAVAALVWLGLRQNQPQPTPVSPEDPIWSAAIKRARETIGTMRALHAEGRVVWVKFPLDAGDQREHVWGLLLAVDDEMLRCTLETPPKNITPPAGPDVRIPLHRLEDWQVLLDDGSVRGGFTTRAQMQIADRDGQPVPRHVRELVARMID